MYDLEGKVVFITGAANGVGEGVVRLLVEEGVKHVAVLDIAEAAGTALQDDLNAKHGAGKVQFYSCDVTDEAQLLGIMATVKREHEYIDLVINNAGIMNDSLQTYKKEIMINVVSLVTGSIRALELMRRDEGGRGGTIINISSVAALCQYPSLPVYWATKSAVLQFSNCLGMDEYYSRTDVRVLTVCFGPTDTALLSVAKVGTFDKKLNARMVEIMKITNCQRMESAAKGVIAAYKLGASGSTWVATRDEPAKDITDDVKRAYDILSVHATLESAAQGVIDAYKKGASGSTWVASRDLPAVDITSNVRRAYEIMGEHN